MKMFTIAIGAGIGYLAGNAEARQKTWAALRNVKESRSAKSIEDRVGGAVSGAVSQLADKRRSTGDEPPISTGVIPDETPMTSDRSFIG
ncbi:MAG: hypothetical protein LH645_08055 [Actinomycetia bacterium]|nr:hypothetical protein [Actinomycetes bacterium]